MNDVKKMLNSYFQIDGKEYDTMQLSRRDKASLLYGAFMICALTIIAVGIIYNVKVAKVNEQTCIAKMSFQERREFSVKNT